MSLPVFPYDKIVSLSSLYRIYKLEVPEIGMIFILAPCSSKQLLRRLLTQDSEGAILVEVGMENLIVPSLPSDILDILVNKISIVFPRLSHFILVNLKNDKYTIKDLVLDLQMSRSTLHRLAKKNFNCSISTVINYIRLQESRKLLLFSEMTISEIAYATGYSSPSYFVSVFKRIMGLTPKVFRINNK